ncbi:leucine-rich repeat domain-containing protein [Paludisphaera soli]|uniref:leucine-rich repeat domain-containing protein n=1 Tax=Paludisphaera soli TaxID=2712865 RepID=UPI0013EBF281|nr:leucine-rich repeat domain-containing protein [Paludisphaera soli]
MSDLEGLALALERIEREKSERTGRLDLGRLGLTELPDALFELLHLEELHLGRTWAIDGHAAEATTDIEPNRIEHGLGRLVRLTSLRKISVEGSRLSDLSPLAGLASLQSLDCGGTQVADLSPLAGLASLQSLDCTNTQVADLSPLAGLASLQSLDCTSTQVADLSPLAGLASLQSLDCTSTQVADLSPLAGLASLQSLACTNTQVADLSPLAGLASLQSLACGGTQVADLSPLAGLAWLQSLACGGTQVADLSPLAGLAWLQSLDCRSTQVADLSPLAGLAWLQSLDCTNTRVEILQRQIVMLPRLARFTLSAPDLREIPAEVLSVSSGDDCLERLRVHFRDLDQGGEWLTDVKALVLGNGRIGKTQICRRLRGEGYDPSVRSTHGIEVTSTPIETAGPDGRGEGSVTIHLWDFGGQDLYHGTHGLFLRARAALLVVWTSRSEEEATHEHEGLLYRNHRLPYWVESVRHAGGADRPLVLVQNQCERAEDEKRRPPVDDAILDAFPWSKAVHYSALSDRGRGSLDDALRHAVEWERSRRGLARIGKGRLAVRRRLEEIQQGRSGPKRRTMERSEFDALCAEVGGVSDNEALLEYLDASDVVIYRRGLFGGRIILDHSWAMEAVYAVFDRDASFPVLRAAQGRFTRSLLGRLVWREYGEAEQELFLDLMTSCGVCFVHREGDLDRGIEAKYIAPDLLPARDEVRLELEGMWEGHPPGGELTVRLPYLNPGLIRRLIGRIGRDAGLSALYWKEGVCFYEGLTKSRALIEQHPDAGPDRWGGRLLVQARGGGAPELLARLRRWLEEVLPIEAGEGWEIEGPPSVHHEGTAVLVAHAHVKAEGSFLHEGEGRDAAIIQPRPAPLPGRSYGVSYAWEDPSRELVDRACQSAEARGISVLRDTTNLQAGDSFTRFVDRLAEDDRRLFVILSDKYLKSEYCMRELLQVWYSCGKDPKKFADRLRVYRRDDANILRLSDQLRYAEFWKAEAARIREAVSGDLDLITARQHTRYETIREIASNIGDMIELIADRIFARDWAEFEEYGFGDDFGPHASTRSRAT